MAKNLPQPPAHGPLEGPRPELTINLHDGSEERVSIIVVHRDRPEYLNICLQSIAVTSLNNNYEIIVVDNGSGKDTQDFLDDIEGEVKVIRNETNVWWSKAANQGAKAADKDSKYLIFLHCDTVVLNPAWIDLLINVSESQDSGLVGVEMGSYFMSNQRVDFIQDWCVLLTRECFKEAGPFPEELPQVGASFILTMNAQAKGYKPQVIRNPILHHYKAFALDFNDYERFQEQATVTIPTLMRHLQTQTKAL
jgi:GT2 family glycosyltransferase